MLARNSMHLMVWLKDICLGGYTEGGVPFTHPTFHYDFLSLLNWGLKNLPLGHQVQILFQLWILFSLILVLVLSSNTLKRWTFSWEIYSTSLPIHLIGSIVWCLTY